MPAGTLSAMDRARRKETWRGHSPERDAQVVGAVIEQIVAGRPNLKTPGIMPMGTAHQRGRMP